MWLKGKAQLAVDSLLMNTHSTGVDSWWAGVPVITLPGYKMPARVGAIDAQHRLAARRKPVAAGLASRVFGLGRDGVLEVENYHVCARGLGLGETLGPVAGNE